MIGLNKCELLQIYWHSERKTNNTFSLGPSFFTIVTQPLVQHFLIIAKFNECILKLCLSSFDSKYENIIFMFLLISADFDGLLKHLTSMRQSKNRIVHTTLTIVLTKMWLGLSNPVLTTLFHLKDKCIISHIINQVRKSLKKNFIHQEFRFPAYWSTSGFDATPKCCGNKAAHR